MRLLRGTALIAVLAGAGGSIYLMLRIGHRNPSIFLLALFAIWDLSPFVGLIVADAVSKRWSVLTRTTLYSVMLVVTLGSLAIYGNVAFGRPRPQPAASFLIVPLASWLLMAIAGAIAALVG